MVYSFIKDYTEPAMIIALSVVILAQIIYLIVMYPLYNGFGWKVFKIVGVDPVLIRKSFRNS